MTLLNAPQFDVQKETRKRNLMIGSGVLALALVLLAVGGFLLGHGWLFINLPAEHRVDTLLSALQAKDYTKAYGIFYNDADWQQHPDKYKGLHAAAVHGRLFDRERLERSYRVAPRRILETRPHRSGRRLDDQRLSQPDVESAKFGRDNFVLPVRADARILRRVLYSLAAVASRRMACSSGRI